MILPSVGQCFFGERQIRYRIAGIGTHRKTDQVMLRVVRPDGQSEIIPLDNVRGFSDERPLTPGQPAILALRDGVTLQELITTWRVVDVDGDKVKLRSQLGERWYPRFFVTAVGSVGSSGIRYPIYPGDRVRYIGFELRQICQCKTLDVLSTDGDTANITHPDWWVVHNVAIADLQIASPIPDSPTTQELAAA